MSNPSGSQLGPYLVGDRVESTGSGEWFTASDAELRRSVSLLVVTLPSGVDDAAALRARALAFAALGDARLLPVYGHGEDQGRLWLAMRQVGSRTLRELGRISEERASRLGAQLAEQLQVLQEHGLAPAALSADDVLVEGVGEQERAWLPPDPLRPSAMDVSAGTRSLVELLNSAVERPWLADVPAGPEALAELLRPRVDSPRRRRARLGVAAGAVLIAALAAGLTVLITHHSHGRESARSPASAPAAHVVARIPLGEAAGSVSLASSAIWVGTQDGTALHVDAKHNEVVGSPIRVGPKKSYVAVGVAGGTLWAAAGSKVLRMNASTGAITARKQLPGSEVAYSLAAAGKVVWVTAVEPQQEQSRAFRFDTKNLRLIAESPALDWAASLVQTTPTGAWITTGTGEFVRLSARQRTPGVIFVGEAASQAAAAFGRVWIPTAPDRTVAVVDPNNLTYERALRFPADTLAVAQLDGSIWVLTQNPSRIYRIDPKSRAFLGRPLAAPKGASVLAAGDGSLWVDNPNDQTLLRLAPTTPAPAAVPMPVASTGALQNGPVAVGKRYTLTSPDFRFSVAAADPGWLGAFLANTGPGMGAIYDIHHLQVGLNWVELTQVFDASGRIRPLKSPEDLVRALHRDKNVHVVSVSNVRLGGATGVRVVVDVRPLVPYAKLCGPTPCTIVAPMSGLTYTLTPGRTEFTLVQRGPKLLVFNLNLAEHPDAQVIARSHRLVDSIRFEH